MRIQKDKVRSTTQIVINGGTRAKGSSAFYFLHAHISLRRKQRDKRKYERWIERKTKEKRDAKERDEIEVRGRPRDPDPARDGAPTFGPVLLGAAARLLRLRVYEIVIRMRADVLPHPQVVAVDLVRVRGVAQRDRRKEDEQPAEKSRRMGHDVSFYATSLRQPPRRRPLTPARRRTGDILVFWNVHWASSSAQRRSRRRPSRSIPSDLRVGGSRSIVSPFKYLNIKIIFNV